VGYPRCQADMMRSALCGCGLIPKFWSARSVELISIYDILGLRRKEATAMGTLRFARGDSITCVGRPSSRGLLWLLCHSGWCLLRVI
jgi:hypothetical protein